MPTEEVFVCPLVEAFDTDRVAPFTDTLEPFRLYSVEMEPYPTEVLIPVGLAVIPTFARPCPSPNCTS